MRNKNKNIMLDLEKITLNVREIALRAGAFLRNERSGFDRSKVEKKNADRKSTRLNSSHSGESRMPSSA